MDNSKYGKAWNFKIVSTSLMDVKIVGLLKIEPLWDFGKVSPRVPSDKHLF